MGFTKGESGNPDGRPKGAKNKASTIGKNKITEYLENGGYDSLITEIKTLKGTEKVKAITDLMAFVMPKLKSVEQKIDFGESVIGIKPMDWVKSKHKNDEG